MSDPLDNEGPHHAFEDSRRLTGPNRWFTQAAVILTPLSSAATDASVDGASRARLARRLAVGVARSGTVAHHGSGEIFMAFGTGVRQT